MATPLTPATLKTAAKTLLTTLCNAPRPESFKTAPFLQSAIADSFKAYHDSRPPVEGREAFLET